MAQAIATRLPVFLVGLLAAAPLAPAADVPWHHAPSLYRAAYTIKTPPTLDNAGYFLEVPLCGIGDADGANVFVFNEENNQLPAIPLGRSRPNTALVLAGPRLQQGKLYAYWGSNQRAPVNRPAFRPGLTVELRALGPKPDVSAWKTSEKVLDASTRLGVFPVSRIELATNLYDTTPAFLMDFKGYLKLDKPEEWEVFLSHDDAGYVFVDDKPLIDRSGRHNPGETARGAGRQKVALSKGLNEVRVVVIDLGGPKMAVLARYVDDKKKFTLPDTAYVQGGRTELSGKVERRVPDQPSPAFAVRQRGYLGVGSVTLTEVELTSLADEELEWRLGNGARGLGKAFHTVTVGTENLTVNARAARKVEGTGLITFADVPPARQFQNAAVFEAASKLIGEQTLPAIDEPTLKGYLELLSQRERHAGVVPVCEALLARVAGPKGAVKAEHAPWLTLLARGAATAAPEQARAAYQKLFTVLELKDHEDLALEYLEFCLYRESDLALAEKALATLQRKPGGKELPGLRLVEAELRLYQGDVEQARKLVTALRDQVTRNPQFRSFAVVGNAELERFKIDLQGGFFALAEQDLREWIAAAPEAIPDGQYALMRTRWLRTLGWHDGAVRVIEGLLKLNELPAFLPDLELEKALALRSLKQADEAKKLFERVVKEYPNHPAAAAAKTELGQK